MKRLTKGLLLGLLFLFSIQVMATVQYEDISPGHWAYGDIINLTELGILSGIKVDGKQYYKGSDPLNRYQTAVLLGKLLKYIDENYQKIGVEVTTSVPEGITETLNRLEMAIKDDAGNIIQLSEVLEIVKELQSRVTTLENKRVEESVPLPQTAVQDILNKIKAISESISYLRLDISTLNENSSSLETELAEAKKRLETANLDILDLKEKFGSLENTVAGLSDSFATKDELNKIMMNLDDLSSTLKMYVSVDELTKTKESLSASVNELFGEISKTRSEMNGRYDELTKSINILGNRIDSFGTIREDISGLQTNFAKISVDLSNLNNAFEALKADYTGFNQASSERMDTLERELTNKLGKNFSYFENLMTDVTNLQDKVGAIETALLDVKNVVEKDHIALTKTASDTEALSAEVTNIKSKISDLETEVLNFPTKESVNRANDNAVMAIYVGAAGIILGIVGVVLYFVRP